MKEKIFLKLKQAYSSLGLGDEVLNLHAESLNALGLVTDENVDAVVAAQKGFLEGLQKNADKRVSDATRKTADELKKQHEEELKKKAEEAEAKKKAEEEAAKKAAEEAARKKAEEDAAEKAKKEAEEAARKKQEEIDKLNDVTELKKLMAEMSKAQADAANAAKEQKSLYEQQLKAMQDTMKAQFEEQMKSVLGESKATKEALEAMKKERDEANAAKAARERQEMIVAKAKELGIPQSRIDEGFAIASDADETAISEHLQVVANNVKVLNLPNRSNHLPAASGTKPSESEVKEIAKQLVI